MDDFNLYDYRLSEWDIKCFGNYAVYLLANTWRMKNGNRESYHTCSKFPRSQKRFERYLKHKYPFDNTAELSEFFKSLKELFKNKTIGFYMYIFRADFKDIETKNKPNMELIGINIYKFERYLETVKIPIIVKNKADDCNILDRINEILLGDPIESAFDEYFNKYGYMLDFPVESYADKKVNYEFDYFVTSQKLDDQQDEPVS